MSPRMHQLKIPNRPKLHEALGRLAIAHTHLELMLRYCIKTLSGLQVAEALDATQGARASDVRKRIKKLFREKRPKPSEETKLDALLGEAARLSERRNSYLHSAWSETEAGETVHRDDSHTWGAAPTEDEVEQTASKLIDLGDRINKARRTGFISEVVERSRRNGAL